MNRRLVITGVTGEKSGAAFVRQLHAHRTDIRAAFPGGIRALVRPSSCTDYLKQMLPDVEIFVGEFVRSELLDQVLAGTDTVVHNAGIQTSLPIVEAAARCHVRRAILVHTTGIYSKYKQAGEGYREIDADVARICRDHNISLTILRPTMIYGTLSDRNVSQFIRMVDRLPLMPVIRGARYWLQPVWFEDLGRAYYLALTRESATAGKNYDLSGGAPILLRDMLSEIGTQLGKKRVRFINCPFALAYTGAFLLRALSLGRIDLREKVQRLCEDRAYPHEAASADFGYDPVSFPEGVRGEIHAYLQSRRKKNGTQI